MSPPVSGGEEGDARGLVLVGDVRVVARGGEPLRAAAQAVLVVLPQVDGVQLDVVLDVSTGRLRMGEPSASLVRCP